MNLWRPIGDYVWMAKVSPANETPGGITLPDICKIPTSEGLVFETAVGKTTRIPLEYGDRAIFPDYSTHQYEEGMCFVKYGEIFAYIRMDLHTGEDRIKACGQWALVVPDPLLRERELDSGIVVSARSLKSGEARELRHAAELYQGFIEFGHKLLAFVHDPQERIKIQRDRYNALSKQDQQLLSIAYEKRGDTGWEYKLVDSSQEVPRSGQLFSLGECADTQEGIYKGDTVYWNHCNGFEMSIGGLQLLAINYKHLQAFIPGEANA